MNTTDKKSQENNDAIEQKTEELNSVRKELADVQALLTAADPKSNSDEAEQIKVLRKELNDLKLVLSDAGALPKKVKSTKPWSSIGRPGQRDIFLLKGKHKGFEPSFIANNTEEIDFYKTRGYTVANGQNYGEQEGPITRRRTICMERPVKDADEDRQIQRDFNRGQRTSTLQKVSDMSDNIRRNSGQPVKSELSRVPSNSM